MMCAIHGRRVSVAWVLGIVAACASGSAGLDDPRAAATEAGGGQVMESSEIDSLRLSISSPDRVRSGEPVPITLRLENLSDSPVEVALTGRPVAFDLEVRDAAGVPVWRRLEGVAVPMILQLLPLEPRSATEWSDTWDQRDQRGNPVPPGAYGVRGLLPTDAPDPWSTPTATLDIVP